MAGIEIEANQEIWLKQGTPINVEIGGKRTDTFLKQATYVYADGVVTVARPVGFMQPVLGILLLMVVMFMIVYASMMDFPIIDYSNEMAMCTELGGNSIRVTKEGVSCTLETLIGVLE